MPGLIQRLFHRKIEAEIETTRLRVLPNYERLRFEVNEGVQTQFKNAYLKNPYVFACVNMISWACGGIRPVLKDKAGIDLPPTHELYKLFQNPNPTATYYDFMSKIYADYALNGNAYVWIERGSATGKILYLWNLPLNEVRIVQKIPRDILEPIDYYEVGENNMKIYPQDMMHFKTYNALDTTKGVSPLQPIASAIEQAILIDIRNASILRKEGKPWLKYKIPQEAALTDDEYEDIQDELRGMSGPDKAGSWIILDNGNDVEELGIKAVDIDFYMGQLMSLRQVCAAFVMPPEKVGDGTNKTYANATEANKQFAQDCVLPKVKEVFDLLRKNLLIAYQDVGTITFDTEDVRDLKGDEAEILKAINNIQFLSVNEKRDKLGYDPISDEEGGSDIILVGGMVTLENVKKGISSSPSGEVLNKQADKAKTKDQS